MMDKLNVKYWYFGIIPVFICSAAAEVLTGLAGPAIGIACGFLMIRFSDEITRKTQRWSVTIGGSLAVALLFWVAPDSNAPIENPYFMTWQLVAQAIIAGVAGIIFYLILVVILRWWQENHHLG